VSFGRPAKAPAGFRVPVDAIGADALGQRRFGQVPVGKVALMVRNWRGPAAFVGRPVCRLLLLLCLTVACVKPATLHPPLDAARAQPSSPPTSVRPQTEWAEAILYFVIVDRFADGDPSNDAKIDPAAPGTFHGGDLRGLREQLDELADLGITALWITPVVKNIDGFVTGAGFPDWAYHGYWADDFMRVDPRFGSEGELKAFVEACRERGIKTLLDVVYNHVGYGSQYLTNPSTRGWFRNPERGECGNDDLTTCVAGLPDTRTELPAVADYLYSAHLGRAERTGVDGFRLDTVKHVAHEFWQEHRRRTRERLGASFFLLGEVWGGDAQVLDPWFEGDELDAGFDFSFQGNVVGFVQGRGRPVAFDHYLQRREDVRPGHLLAHFLSSHDVPGALWQLKGDTQLFRLAAVLQFTARGIPVIYYGEEVGRIGGDWPQNRSDMPWGERPIQPGAGEPRDEGLREFYKRLIGIRRAHPSLWRGERTGLAFTQDMLAFSRRDTLAGDAVVVAVNRGAESQVARFAPPPEWGGEGVYDLLAEEELPQAQDEVEITVPGRSARILGASRGEQSDF
jgi:glycosidase